MTKQIEQSREKNLTEGPIGKKLILFALPLLVGNLIQQLNNTIDLIFVGRVLGKEASAAVGASSLLITLLLGFFTGLSVGAGIVVAQAVGDATKERIRYAVHTAMALGFLGGAVLTVAGYLLAPLLLTWINTPAEIFEMATSYIRIYFFSLTAIISYNMGAGILRAVGDSRTPMLCQLIGSLVHISLNALFLFGFKWGIQGVALVTFFSQGVAAALVLIHLRKADKAYRLHFSDLRLHRSPMMSLLRLGIPIGCQSMLITLSNVFVQYRINGLGVNVIAAFTAYFKVELIIYLPIVAFGQAMTTFTAQNFGVNRIDRVKAGTKQCFLMSGLMTVSLSVAMLLIGRYAFAIFNPDTEVIDIGVHIICITFPFYFLYVILEVLGASVRGCGNSVAPMLIILCNICLLRTTLLLHPFFYSRIPGVAMTYPITWFVTSCCMAVLYGLVVGRRKPSR